MSIFIVVFFLSSCQEDQVSPTAIVTVGTPIVSSNIETPTTITVESTIEKTATPSQTATSVPESAIPSPTLRPTSQISTVTPTPTEESVSNLQIQCGQIFSDVNEIASPSVEGIVLQNQWSGQDSVGVLGLNGVESPAFIWSVAEESFNTYVSPDGQWLAYFDYDFDASPAIVTVYVLNTVTQQTFQKQVVNENLGGLLSGWLNNSELMIGLANEGDLFSFIKWLPFTGESELITVELTGYGFPDAARFPIQPVFDPLSELVIYPCYASECLGDVYRVKELNSGEISWSLDFGEDNLFDYRNIAWSPNGQLIVVSKDDLLRNPLIFNRNGELVHEIILPDSVRLGGAFFFSWSPNNQYLAFIRVSTDADGNPNRSLAYFRLADETIVDLCVYPSLGSVLLEWSPDSTRIAYGVHINPLANFEDFVFQGYAIDIFSGDAVMFFETDGYNQQFLVGWTDT